MRACAGGGGAQAGLEADPPSQPDTRVYNKSINQALSRYSKHHIILMPFQDMGLSQGSKL